MARSLLLVCLAVVCGAAGFREFHGAQADRIAANGSPESLREALRYAPDDPAKWRDLGIAQIRAGTGDAVTPLERAIQLDPCDAEALVGLGYESERLQRLDEAEQFYRRAAQCSRRFQPRYALAGYYLRTGQHDSFWPAASEAVNTPEADVTRALKLAQTAGFNPNEIAAKIHLRTAHARAAYVGFALASSAADDAAAIALQLPSEDKYLPVLVHACERLIQAGRSDAAVAIWNRLPDVDKLDPADGRSLAGDNFSEPRNNGFHWRYTRLPGTTARATGTSGLRLEFSGNQPERGPLLVKMAPVLPARKYRLTFTYSSDDLPGQTGLAWTVAPWNGTPIAAATLDGAGKSTASAEFVTPANCTLLRLSLDYTRVKGTVRIEGAVHLRSARMELLQ